MNLYKLFLIIFSFLVLHVRVCGQEVKNYDSYLEKYYKGDLPVNEILEDSKTIFHFACERMDTNFINSILLINNTRHLKFDDLYWDSLSVFDIMCIYENTKLLDKYLNLENDFEEFIEKSNLLKYCCNHNSLETFKYLINKGFKVETDSYIPMVMYGNDKLIKYIEKYDYFDISVCKEDLKFYALLSGKCEIINHIYEKNNSDYSYFEPEIKVFITNIDPLEGIENIERTLNYLETKGIDINELDDKGNNVLYHCGENLKLFQLLIECGASRSNINLKGQNLIDAISSKHSFNIEGNSDLPEGPIRNIVNRKIELLRK